MTPVRPIAAIAVALGLSGALAVPIPAFAAPCVRAELYAAQAGAELLRLNRLDLRPSGRPDEPVTDVGLSDSQSAFVANGKIKAATATRLLDATGGGPLTTALIQQAPPTHPRPSTRATKAGEAGPFTLGAGTLSSHARWRPAMACAAEAGQTTRAATTLRSAALLNALVSVRKTAVTESTTQLKGTGAAARSVATTTVGARTLDLLDGAVRVEFQRAPTLTASIGARNGAAVSYRPPSVEVSGKGIDRTRLDTAGDYIEITLGSDSGSPAGSPESTDPRGAARSSGKPGHGDSTAESVPLPSALAHLGKKRGGRLSAGLRLPVPTVPGLPEVGDDTDEGTQIPPTGTRLKISLGELRQATSGHAVAARATAIKILLTQATTTKSATGQVGPGPGAVVLDLDFGRLEAAAVAPGTLQAATPGSHRGTTAETPPGAAIGGPPGAIAGGPPSSSPQGMTSSHGTGLPITGPRVAFLLITGLVLLAVGATALLIGSRWEHTPAGRKAPVDRRLRTPTPGSARIGIGWTALSEPPID
jgi:hypothetical protein